MWRANYLCWALAAGLVGVADAQQFSDPTAPPRVIERGEVGKGPATSFKLQSIQWIGTQRSALINGERKYEGDMVSQYLIDTIDINEVILRHQSTNKTMTLRLFGFAQQRDNQLPGSEL